MAQYPAAVYAGTWTVGHLLSEGRLTYGIEEDKACDRFAGAFLALYFVALQLLGQQQTKQCGVITDSAPLSMFKRFSAKGWRKSEPGAPLPQEHPRLFDQLVYRALANQYISEDKAAEFLRHPNEALPQRTPVGVLGYGCSSVMPIS